MHIGVIQFGDNASLEFNFIDFPFNKAAAMTAIDSIEKVRGRTYADKALALAREQLFVTQSGGSRYEMCSQVC